MKSKQEHPASIGKKKVIVIGGGTGTHTVLKGLKKYHDTLDLAAIVTMADSGGSTGRLRDEFGYLPVGDARMALVALAADVNDHDELMRKLFLYRFAKGGGLSGHNFGNLLLTALTDILGSEVEAIETASRILRIRGTVIPVSLDNVQLQASYSDGDTRVGEHSIDEPDASRYPHSITKISLTPKAQLNPHAKQAILEADLIVFGPGDLYTSILANCVVDGFPEVMKKTKAETVFISNLVTKVGQTTGMSALDHLQEIERYCSISIDTCVINKDVLPTDLLEKYAQKGEYPVDNETIKNTSRHVIETSLLDTEDVVISKNDVVRRSLLRHNSEKLAKTVLKLVH